MNTTSEQNNNNSRVLSRDGHAAASHGKRVRNILIFDDDPASLRLVHILYVDSAGSCLSQYYLLIIAFVILGFAFAVVTFW
jgi:hypothetical protein